MRNFKRLVHAWDSAHRIKIDETSKIILFSDCHRGDKSPADDFARNENIFLYALEQYYRDDFTYIEIGDGDELWENSDFEKVYAAHQRVYDLLRLFAQQHHYYLIFGNHDFVWSLPENQQLLEEKISPNIFISESIVLDYCGQEIFCVHGHQVDAVSCRAWKLSRFFVRHVWKKLQNIGVNDMTSPAQSARRRNKVEKRLISWSETNHKFILAGHTHRQAFPDNFEERYLNTGSCIYPYCISGIEILSGEIYPIWWYYAVNENGFLCVKKRRVHDGIMLSDLTLFH